MSDISNATLAPQTSTPRRRGPAARKHFNIDGKAWKPRDEVADTAGISHRTGARVFKARTKYIAGVAYVPEQDALRDLVNPPAPTTRRRRNPNT
jgi:hypothetical protein